MSRTESYEARGEYDKVIIAAKKQAEYLVENDIIKKEAEKRADALISEAENHSRYIKLRSYEYVDSFFSTCRMTLRRLLQGTFSQ